jgi:hypothetical protein
MPVPQHRISSLQPAWDRPPGLSGPFSAPCSKRSQLFLAKPATKHRARHRVRDIEARVLRKSPQPEKNLNVRTTPDGAANVVPRRAQRAPREGAHFEAKRGAEIRTNLPLPLRSRLRPKRPGTLAHLRQSTMPSAHNLLKTCDHKLRCLKM